MKIKQSYVRAFQRIRNNEPADASDQRAALWQQIRDEYNLPTDTKFKIELDGPLAGELRASGSDQPWFPEYDFTVYVWRDANRLMTQIVFDGQPMPKNIPEVALAFSGRL